jgi:glycine/D-amino acid oxidase-like deaminating enzyme
MNRAEQKQEHTRSYYAATANEHSDYPELQGAVEVDICVVGAGFTGIASALTLAERGYRVAVVEANRVGWGASGRNGGQLIAGISSEHKLLKKYGDGFARDLWDLRWRGNDIVLDRIDKYGIRCDFTPGYLEVAPKPSHLPGLQEEFERLQAFDHPHGYRLLDRQEVREATGTMAWHGGLLTQRNGHLHPLNLCLGEARAAHGLGVQIFEQSPVLRIEHGTRPKVHTENGHVEADAVVLAGNAYHQLESKHLSGLVFPAGSYIIATEPLSAEQRREVNPINAAVCDTYEIVDYYRYSADGRMLYGGRCNYSGRDPRSIKAAIMPRMLRLYPQLKNLRVDYEWGGKIGIVLNRIPALGRINGNVYYVQGYSGHGVNATHIMGEIVADAIGGTMEKFDLFEQVKHFRIPGGQWLGSQMIALGMLYFRLKDKLS